MLYLVSGILISLLISSCAFDSCRGRGRYGGRIIRDMLLCETLTEFCIVSLRNPESRFVHYIFHVCQRPKLSWIYVYLKYTLCVYVRHAGYVCDYNPPDPQHLDTRRTYPIYHYTHFGGRV